MEKGERTHRRGASDLGSGEEEEEGGRKEGGGGREEEEEGRRKEEGGGRRRRRVLRCSPLASAPGWRTSGRIGISPVCQHLPVAPGLAAGFPERCHLPLLSPPHLASPGPGGCPKKGENLRAVSLAEPTLTSLQTQHISAPRALKALESVPTQVRWCQRPQGGERLCFPSMCLKSEKLLSVFQSVFSLLWTFLSKKLFVVIFSC